MPIRVFVLLTVLLIASTVVALGFRRHSQFARAPQNHARIRMASLDGEFRSLDGVEQIDLLYDSECPICQMEVDFLKKRDVNNRIRFTDLSSSDYNPADHGNVRFEDGMRKIRAVLPGNKVVTGVEVRTVVAPPLPWVACVAIVFNKNSHPCTHDTRSFGKRTMPSVWVGSSN
jgi:hypothetical protein